MPFQSERQRRFMHAKHPEIAQRWEREYGAAPAGRRKPVAPRAKRGRRRPA